jgi:hypothetical protein
MRLVLLLSAVFVLLGGFCCQTSSSNKQVSIMETATKKEMACKLTTPELQKRKAEVIASLKDKVIFKQEINNGYKYKFDGDDQVIDELVAFIKTERLCCDFFSFGLSIDGDYAWLSISGPDGAKGFIEQEMEL